MKHNRALIVLAAFVVLLAVNFSYGFFKSDGPEKSGKGVTDAASIRKGKVEVSPEKKSSGQTAVVQPAPVAAPAPEALDSATGNNAGSSNEPSTAAYQPPAAAPTPAPAAAPAPAPAPAPTTAPAPAPTPTPAPAPTPAPTPSPTPAPAPPPNTTTGPTPAK